MSRAGYADFFPAAPSVLAEKKAQAERERTRQRSHREYDRDTSNGALPTTSLANTGSTSTNSSTVTSTQTVTKSALPSHLLHTNNRSPTISNSSPPVLPSPPIGTRHSLPPRPQVSLVQPYPPKEPPPLPPPPPALPTPKATPPAIKQDPAKRNWKLKYDPVLEKKGVPKKSKDIIFRFDGEGVSGPITDPRLAIPDYSKGPMVGKKKLRNLGLYRARWKWDENYIGPGPPSQILISGLSPLTTENEISMHFRAYGEISKIGVKVDPATGGSLGICSILYRDNVRTKSPAHEGAKNAVAGGNGTTIGMQKIRVELDRDGLKGKKMAGRIVDEKRRKEQEAAKNRPKPPPIPRDDHVRSSHRAESPLRGRGASPARKENRTLDRERERERDRDRDRDSRPPETQKENYKALDHVGRWPYIFITARCIPGDQRYVRHLEGRLKNFGLKSVLCDRTGFYVVFWEKRDMEKCFRVCDGDRLFSYKMLMEMHPGGTRTPSPGRNAPKVAEARPVDFLAEATTALMKEMKIALMTDLKKRIVAPTIYDSLESGRLHKKRKVEEAESKASTATNEVISSDNVLTAVKDERATSVQAILSLNPISKTTSRSISTKPVKVTLPRFKKRIIPKKEEPPKINGLKKKPLKKDARPLAHRLNQYDSEGVSDDESTATGDRPVSRGLSTDIGDDESTGGSPLVDHIGNLKRKRVSVGPTSKLRDTAVSTDDEEPIADEDRMDIKEETMSKKPRLSDNERSPLVSECAEDELEGALLKEAKSKENKKRKCDIDFTSSESEGEDSVVAKPVERTKKKKQGSPPSRRPPVDDEDEIVNVIDDYDDINDSIAIKSVLKTGKALGESRVKVRAEAASVEVSKTMQIDMKLPVDEETDEDIPKEVVDVSWGVSTAEGPIAAVDDDEDMVLDLDGWQILVKDEEDFSFLKAAIAQEKVEPANLGNVAVWAFKQKEMKVANREGMRGATRTQEKIEGFYRPNLTGCARTEGYRKIPEKEKSMYLPHRLQVAAKRAAMNQPPSPSAPTTATKPAGSTSRSNRVNNRRLVANLQNQKQIFSSDADVMRFNQLKKRKKPVRFARSAIHNWGLYAMENIAANDMIIEYVGEIVRQQVADMREVKYLKSGIGSSYLFRIDENTVIDATKRGGIARFINHSCTPNCTAKIIKVEGSKRIVIYALRDIKENEELTYDYKFERELGSDDRIPCLCGSSGCKGFLN